MDKDAYLNRIKEANSDNEREENTNFIEEEFSPILGKIQSIVKFEKETLCVSNLKTNIRNPKDKRHVNINTMEYDIGPLGIESNVYIINQDTKILSN